MFSFNIYKTKLLEKKLLYKIKRYRQDNLDKYFLLIPVAITRHITLAKQ